MTRFRLAIAAILLLVAVLLLLNVDWVLWKRWWNRPEDLGEWPASYFEPSTLVPGGNTPFFATTPPDELTIPVAALEEAAGYAETHNTAALLVLHRGRLQLERYWQGIGSDSLFSGRAMTRSILAALVGIALDEGALESLDEPIANYLSEWANDPRGAITVRQLLWNVSGLEVPPLDDASPFSKNARISIGSDFAAAAMDFEYELQPGAFFAFSNANAQLIGVILERATGRPYETYLDEKLWAPLGAGGARLYMDREEGMPAVFCCYRATPRDWLRLASAYVSDGVAGGRQLWPQGWLREIGSGSEANPNYGFQLWVGNPPGEARPYVQGTTVAFPHGPPIAAEDVMFFEGGGFRTIYIIPSEQLAIVRLGYTHPDWRTSALPNILLDGLTGAREENGVSEQGLQEHTKPSEGATAPRPSSRPDSAGTLPYRLACRKTPYVS